MITPVSRQVRLGARPEVAPESVELSPSGGGHRTSGSLSLKQEGEGAFSGPSPPSLLPLPPCPTPLPPDTLRVAARPA
jgi:hypothetical protein